MLVGAIFTLSGCNFLPKGQAQPSVSTPDPSIVAVDVTTAKTGILRQPREYTGITQPLQEVSLRSQAEGQLLRLNVNVGDRVETGQVLGQVDDTLLRSAVTAAESELANRQAQVAQARTQLGEANTRVEQARLNLQQANADAARFGQLATAGASTQQQAEQAQLAADTAAQVLRSTQEQVSNQDQAIIAAESRVTAQQAAIAEAQERLDYATLKSPIAGSVLQKVSEVGNLVQPNSEIVKLGDFSSAKVLVQVSELDLAKVQVGRPVQLRLDAFPKKTFTGTIARLAPAADTTARLVPVEIIVPNPSGEITSGLLARVTLERQDSGRVVIPASALPRDRGNQAPQAANSGSPAAGNQPQTTPSSSPSPAVDGGASQPANSSGGGRQRRGNASSGNPNPASQDAPRRKATLFVIEEFGSQPTAKARSVTLGEQADGKVEILAGLKPGDRFVVRPAKPLKDGDKVRLSFLSEPKG
jgi:RND family efflux transporter MFP subunit